MVEQRHLIIGNGEVGSALAKVLGATYAIEVKDIEDKAIKPGFDVMHVCLNFAAMSQDDFVNTVREYAFYYAARLIDNCATVTPGTTRMLGDNACHSTTRGLHPHLAESILTFEKFIAGPCAGELAASYRLAGVKCRTYNKPETTELAHPLSNAYYGVCLAFMDEAYELCRQHGVDFMEAVVAYNQAHNAGYLELDHPGKLRPILYPPHGQIGGHCVREGARILLDSVPESVRAKLHQISVVAGYQKP